MAARSTPGTSSSIRSASSSSKRPAGAGPAAVSSTRVTRPSPVSSTASVTQPCWRRPLIMAETVGLVTALAAASSPARREPPRRYSRVRYCAMLRSPRRATCSNSR